MSKVHNVLCELLAVVFMLTFGFSITTAATAGATLARQCAADRAPILLVTSDFTRAMDTACGVHVALASSHGVAPASVDVRLRERFFGDHNGLDHSRYKIVWADFG